MTSLQKEEFFELVATAQARRLDDQRAQLERSPQPKPKARSIRGSIKQLSFVKKPAPVPVPKEDLYNMILTTQVRNLNMFLLKYFYHHIRRCWLCFLENYQVFKSAWS